MTAVRVGWWAALIVAVVMVGLGHVMVAVGVACPTEDSRNCVWWGPVQGNGRGAIVINIGR